MIRLSLTLLAVLLSASVAWAQCPAPTGTTYWASPTGTGNGLTQSTPYKIQNFVTNAAHSAPGNTLCLLDGTYRGADNMIDPPSGRSGSSGSPITVRALNDGGVLLDGEFARAPIFLSGNSWWVIEGVNAKNGTTITLWLTGGSNDNVFRRVVAWDARADHNGSVVWAINSERNVFEDLAAFGVGRVTFQVSQGGAATICRRCWARWEGSINIGPKMAYQMAYNTKGFICENCIGAFSGESMPQEYDLYNNGALWTPVQHFTNFGIQDPRSIFWATTLNIFTDKCAGLNFLGGAAYAFPGDRFSQSSSTSSGAVRLGDQVDCVTAQDIVVATPGAEFSGEFPLQLTGPNSGATGANRVVNRASAISNGSNSIDGVWSQTQVNLATSLAGIPDPWTTTTGANLCSRYINGQKTTEPLWPWPMNQRIKDATASAGAYSGPCPTCVGGRLTRSATDVTAVAESLLGPIPNSCRSGGQPPPPPSFPDAPDFPSTGVLDGFNRANEGPPPSASWTNLTGSGLKVVSNTAVPNDANFHSSRWNTSLNANQEVFVRLAALPAEGGSQLVASYRIQDANTRYSIGLRRVAGSNNDQAVLAKFVAGVFTELGSSIELGFDIGVNDETGARAVGPDLCMYYRRAGQGWKQLGCRTDTSIQAGGFIGIGTGGTGAFDDFGGGNFTGQSNPPPSSNTPAMTEIKGATEIRGVTEVRRGP